MLRLLPLWLLLLVALGAPAVAQDQGDDDDPFAHMFGEDSSGISGEDLPSDPLERGVTLLRKGRLDEAEATLRRVVKDDPSSRPGLYWLARVYLLCGRGQDVDKVAAKLIELGGDEAYGYVLQGIRAEQKGELEQAQKLYGVAHALTRKQGGPLKLEILVRLGELLADTDERPQAGRILEEALEYYQRHDDLSAAEFTWVARACRDLDTFPAIKSQYARRMIDYSRRMLDQALLADGSYVPAQVEAGTLSLMKYDAPAAKQAFEKAVALDPNSADARVGLARAQLESWALGFERFAMAAKNLQAALAIDPNHPGAQATLAAMAVTDGLYDDALERLDNALRARPDNVELLAVKAACLMLRGDDAGFQAVEQAVLKARPRCAEFYEQVAQLVGDKFRYAEARDLARKALKINPDYHPVLAILGVNLTRTNQEEEGRKVLEQAFEQDPYNVYTYNQLQLFDRLGKNYQTVETEHFTVRLAKDETASIPYVLGLLREARAKLMKKYGAIPDKVLIELFPDHNDFSARSVGLPGIPALGVCFGNVVTVLSAKEKKATGTHSWGRTLWHEFTHVATLTRSKNRVPRWLTEGLSVFEESRGRPSWAREYDEPIMTLMAQDLLLPIAELDSGFTKPRYGNQVIMSYYQGGITCEFIQDRWGFAKILALLDAFRDGNDTAGAIRDVFGLEPEAFDALFHDYLSQRYAKYAYRPPASPEQRQALLAEVGAHPWDVGARGALALASALYGMQADAEQHAGLALRLARQAVEPWGVATGAELQEGLPGGAALATARLASIRAGAADANLALALVALRRGDPDRGLVLLTRALELGTRDPVLAHKVRADVFRGLGKLRYAIADLKQVMHLTPPNADLHRLLGALWQQLGQTERAMEEVKQACLLDSEDVEGRLRFAQWARQQGRWDEVAQVMDDFNMIDPFQAPAHMLLGEALRRTTPAGQTEPLESALREYEAALELGVDYKAGALVGEADCNQRLGHTDKALEQARAALEDDPDNAEAKQLLTQLGAAPAPEQPAPAEQPH